VKIALKVKYSEKLTDHWKIEHNVQTEAAMNDLWLASHPSSLTPLIDSFGKIL
jgi:hypothetical protein